MTTKAHNAKVNGQRGAMDLVKLIEQFADEDRCRAHLEELRWPDGVRCLRCGFDKVSRIQAVTRYRRDTKDGHKKGEVRSKRNQFDCLSCSYHFSVTSGTVLQDTHLPLWKWFLAAYLMTESKKGMSANQLKRTLNVSYEAAWFLCHRVRWAMSLVSRETLRGIVEADETYIGGVAHGGSTAKARANQRLRNKSVVLGAIERDGNLRLRLVADNRGPTIKEFLSETVEPDAEAIFTDAHRSYREAHGTIRHEYVDHSADEWVRGEVHTNSIESAWSLFDRAVIGSYHQLSKKHLGAYLSEFEFRFNNRENLFLFRDTLIALVTADPLTYEALTAEKAPGN